MASTPSTSLTRRRWLAAVAAAPWAAGCASVLPLADTPPPPDADAAALLADSAAAHGSVAYAALTDINVAYEGQWRPLIDRLQPVLVDLPFRKRSEERLLPRERIVAQAHRGDGGAKQVWRRPGDVAVWVQGQASDDRDVLDAAALVADGYAIFLLGPLWLAGRTLPMRRAGTEDVNGRLCDVIDVWLQPGLGRVALDRLALAIDRETKLMRRVRFTLEGLRSTQGAVAEVDTFDHVQRFGVTWPTRFYERLRRPIPQLPVHDWRMTGLDVNRGYGAEALAGPKFNGAAVAPAVSTSLR